jgi:hypothetical protein
MRDVVSTELLCLSKSQKLQGACQFAEHVRTVVLPKYFVRPHNLALLEKLIVSPINLLADKGLI